MPNDTLMQMYRGIVEPHFHYCCSVWGSCGATRLQALKKLQNRAARIAPNYNYDISATQLIKNLKWLTISDMKTKTATETYKATTGLAPGYLSNLFTIVSDRSLGIS